MGKKNEKSEEKILIFCEVNSLWNMWKKFFRFILWFLNVVLFFVCIFDKLNFSGEWKNLKMWNIKYPWNFDLINLWFFRVFLQILRIVSFITFIFTTTFYMHVFYVYLINKYLQYQTLFLSILNFIKLNIYLFI